MLAEQGEFGGVAADRRHRIGDEHRAVQPTRGDRHLECRRMDVEPVDDQPEMARPILQRGADHAGLAAAELGHRVEQVGEARQPLGQRGAGLVVIGHAVAARDEDALRAKLPDRAGRRQFGRERNEPRPPARLRQPRQHRLVDPREARIVMDALLGGIEMRPLDMQAEHARHAFGQRGLGRRDRGVDDGRMIADQGRQHAGRAEAPVRLRDGAEAVDRRAVVEQDVAAAIDLRVDEARHEPAATEIDPGPIARKLGQGHPAGDPPGFDQERAAVQFPIGEDQPGADKSGPRHNVRVTLARCGGRSGSRPRASERALARP